MTRRLHKQTARRLTLPLTLLPLAFAGSAAAADAPFGGGDEIGVAEPVSILAGDFNNDGRADLYASSNTAGYGVIRLAKEGGGFEAAPNVDTAGNPLYAAAGDFNGDGNEDLAIPQFGKKEVRIRLGTGSGTFTSTDDVSVPRSAYIASVGDFNTDGKEDLAIQNRDPVDGPELSIRLGLGDGKFQKGSDLNFAARPIATGDLNSDGNEDIVYGTVSAPSANGLVGKGGGVFEAAGAVPIADAANFPRSVALGDFNSDGKLDLAAAANAKNVVSVRLGTGDGKFGPGPDVPVGGTPGGLAVGDVDGDGNQDVVTANNATSSASVRLGDGAGGFADGGEVPVGREPVDVALADFNGDGRQDLAVANRVDGSVSVRYGTGASPLAGNLLVNGGFEDTTASGVYSTAPAIPGWERRGGMTYIRYGLPSHAFLRSPLEAPRFGGGTSLLWGGNSTATNGITEAFQDVDVSSRAASIDAGKATANLSAYLGGTMLYGDRMGARAEFLGAGDGVLGSFAIGPVTAQDRNNLTTLLRRAASSPVPAGTRRIRVTLTSTDDDKAYSSATADNVRLTLDAPAVPQPPAAFGADTRVKLALAARRIRPSAPVRVRVANGNAFDVTGSVKLGRRTARVQLAPNGRAVVKLRLAKKLRRQLVRRHRLSLRLSALVRDPAGNRRTVHKRALVRTATRR